MLSLLIIGDTLGENVSLGDGGAELPEILPASGGSYFIFMFAFSLLLFPPPGGGGGGTQQSFIREGSAPMSKPLPFYIPFLTEKVPFCIPFIEKWYPSHIPTQEHCIPFLNSWNDNI